MIVSMPTYAINTAPATGMSLDRVAALWGVTRNRYLFVFKESDYTLRNRLCDIVRNSLHRFCPGKIKH